MIKYNFKYRGPFEYDKFILNVLQFHNEVVMLHGQVFRRGHESHQELLDLQNRLTEQFDSSNLAENIYYESLRIE